MVIGQEVLHPSVLYTFHLSTRKLYTIFWKAFGVAGDAPSSDDDEDDENDEEDAVYAPGYNPLGGPWDLVTTYSWDDNLTYNWVTPISPFRGIMSRVISPVITNY